jgi:hypothetical protein
MARYVANVDTTTETFGTWVIRTNQLLDALSTEVITANATFANTGTTAAQRNARLYGSFAANTLIAETALRGGTTSTAANLEITSNAVFTGAAVNVASNTTFTANITTTGANVFINGTRLDITSNVVATARVVTVTSNTQSFKSNSDITVLAISGNGTTSNTTIAGNLVTISANVVISGTNHTVAGNVNFDTGTLFVDAAADRVGINNPTPDASLAVVGTANVSGNVNFTGTGVHTIAGNVNF